MKSVTEQFGRGWDVYANESLFREMFFIQGSLLR